MEGIKISLFEPDGATVGGGIPNRNSLPPPTPVVQLPLPIRPGGWLFAAFLIRSVSHQQLCFWFSVYRLHCLPTLAPFHQCLAICYLFKVIIEGNLIVIQLDRICQNLIFREDYECKLHALHTFKVTGLKKGHTKKKVA